MRLLVFSDLHAHAFRPCSEVLPSGRNSRLQDALNVLENIYQLCKDRDIDGVLCGGDLFHARSVLNVATFNDVYEAIAKIKTIVQFFVLVVGNHDQSNKLGTIHSTKTFGAVIDVVDEARWCTLLDSHFSSDVVHVLCIPFTEDKERILKAIKSTRPPGSKHLMLGHFGVSGAEPGANFVLKSTDLVTLPDLMPDTFQDIFLGHYHMHQELLSNVRFIGAPMQHNWGDINQHRGVLIYDTESRICEKVPIIVAPRFVRIVPSSIENPLVQNPLVQNNFVRVVLNEHISREEWDKLKTQVLTEYKARWVEEWLELPESASIVVQSFTPSMDIEDMIDPYVDSEADQNLDPDLLKELGHEFIRNCR